MPQDREKSFFVIGMLFVACIFLLPAGIYLNAWAISTLWAWFAVPLGVKAISMTHALGVGLIVTALTGPKAKGVTLKNDKGEYDYDKACGAFGQVVSETVVQPLFLVAIGKLYLWLGS